MEKQVITLQTVALGNNVFKTAYIQCRESYRLLSNVAKTENFNNVIRKIDNKSKTMGYHE